MQHSSTREVGLDVHQDASAVASVAHAHDAEGIDLGPRGTRQGDIEHLVRQLQANAHHLIFVDEAGPWGAWRYRDGPHKGDDCWVVAPAVSPQKAGDRVNTDRRAAVPWARLMRSGDRTPLEVPTVADDARRDRRRARKDTLHDLTPATWRLNAFLLRHARRYTGRATGGPAHLRWRSEVVCPTSAQPMVFQAYVRAVNAHTDRLQRPEQELHEQVTSWRLQPVVAALQALRAVQFTVAVTTLAELGDLTRFDTPRQLRQS